MNILLINHYSGAPIYGMEYRPYYLSREWVKAGHKVFIAAASYSHLRKSNPLPEKFFKTSIVQEKIDNIEYNWYNTTRYYGNGVKRSLNILLFLYRLWMDSKRIVQEFHPNVVIASSTYPMDIWVSKRLAWLAKAKLIFEVHDLWPLSPIEIGNMSIYHPFIQICQKAEDYAYQNADAVVSILPKVHKHMEAHGLDLQKLHIIPNGISPEDWQKKSDTICVGLKEYIKAAHDNKCIIIGYAGAHGLANALDYLLDAAKLVKNRNICFLLVGDGSEKERLQKRLINESICNMSMFPPVNRAEISLFLEYIDIAFIGLQKKPLFRFGVCPNKLMDYMMAAKPIISAITAGNDPVEEADCGFTVQAESPKAIADALLRLVDMTEDDRKKMGLKGRIYVLANHAYPVLAKKFLAIMEKE